MNWERLDLSAPEYERPTEAPTTCGLIYSGKRHAISGPPEAAKTLVACILGLERMRAGHGPFALVDFEMGEHATRLLLHDLGATLEEIAAVYYVAPLGPPNDADIEAIAAAGVTLVVIDAAAGAFDASGLDDNKRADAEAFATTWVRPLWQRQIATILLDHVVKNSDSRGRYAIGSERKLGAVDVHLGLEAIKPLHRGAEGLVRITTHKDRPGHLSRPHAAEINFTSDPDTNAISWLVGEASASSSRTGDSWMPTALMEKVSRFLEGQTDPLSRGTIVEAVGGQRKYVLQAIDHLISGGYATATEGARGAKLTSYTQPFRVPDPFSPVPENGTTSTRSPVPPPTGGNGNENGSDDPETQRLIATYGDNA